MRTFFRPLLAALLLPLHTFAQEARPQEEGGETHTHAITGNPAAVNVDAGTGQLGTWLGLPEASGLRLGGVWLGDSNVTLSGGQKPGRWSFNQLLILGLTLDAQKTLGWHGASFGVQFLQFNGQSVGGRNTNELAGALQGYNSLPGPRPLDRSQLYQYWYRQALWEGRVVLRIGKQVPTYDFNNVARPVATGDAQDGLAIPSVTGLLYTPVFVNPTLLGAIGGYYNSVFGASLSLAPTTGSYLRYGIYDGNVAAGAQTGLSGPRFNQYRFQIGEAGVDWVLAYRYPGNFGVGAWHQSGRLHGPGGRSEDGTGGYYFFGSQRLWERAGHGADDPAQRPSVSGFLQWGLNRSQTLPMTHYFGGGFTGYRLIPGRPGDSLGLGASWARTNPHLFERGSEWMFQAYYQAHLGGALFFQPALTYLPRPAAAPDLSGAWAATFRLTFLF